MALVDALRAVFAAHANPALAAPMQAYMKSVLPFHGIPAPLRRQLTAAVVKAHPQASTDALVNAMLALWRGARYREERYAALDVARMGHRHRKLAPESFDAKLLYDTILPSIGRGRFADEVFIRKGIGWALRERSYAAPDEVAAFCREYAGALSPLTRREALRLIARRAAGKTESR